MSSVKGQLDYDRSRHLNYISTAAFGDRIFTYTRSQNATTLVYTGTLRSLLSVGTASGATGYNTLGGSVPTAPAGRILRVNGRKLFPGANPCSTITVSSGGTSGTSVSSTVSQLYSQMVGVIDVVTGLSGFIDPNDSVFAIYNVDKAIDFPNDGANPSNVAHRGPSLYTAGNVTADGNVTAGTGFSLTAGNLAITGSAAQVIPYVATTSPYAFATNTGTLYSFTAAAAVALNATTVPPTGSIVIIQILGAFTTTPNTGFKSTGTVTPTGTNKVIVTYISDGTSLIELFRSGQVPA